MIGVHNSVSFEVSRLTRRIILITIIAITAVALECHNALALSDDSRKSLGVPEARQAVNDFKKIVDKINNGLRKGTFMLAGGDGRAFYVRQINLVEVPYDVKETNSLISPFSGVIRIVSKNSTNSRSPRANSPHAFRNHQFNGFATAKDAMAAIQLSDFSEGSIGKWDANYAYQDEKWVFVPPTEMNMLSDLERYPENQEFRQLFLP